jgi:FKBP-type peptidyl-prolyl cis-trans isomerase 2
MANQTAELGDTVKVHYVGKLSDGEVFDQSKQEEPISFEIGKGQLIQGFEQAVVGMAAGDTKTEQVPYDFAYGERRDDLVLELDKDKIPEHLNPQVGDQLEIKQDEGNNIPVVVKNITEEGMTIDANHPLAGQDLTFELELVEISGKGSGSQSSS